MASRAAQRGARLPLTNPTSGTQAATPAERAREACRFEIPARLV